MDTPKYTKIEQKVELLKQELLLVNDSYLAEDFFTPVHCSQDNIKMGVG
jgi:hypothetical protein